MRRAALAAAFVIGAGLFAAPAHLQQNAVPKGGEEETGPYDVVPDWPQEWAKDGYIWGSQPGVFAESPDRIFIAARGELKKPATLPRGWNGTWGSTGQTATTPTAELRNCIVVVNRDGKLVESWTRWDHLFEGGQGPHKIKINPYDPEKHVWVVDDGNQQIYEFSNDGSQLVLTLGEKGVAGSDGTHFGRPQDLTFLRDGSILVADGLSNTRVAKFDRTGKFVMQWGEPGDGPGQFRGLHGIDADGKGKVYVADRSNHRIQVFDESGKFLDVWPGLRQPNHVVVAPDGNVWVADGTNARLLKFDPNGRLLYWWGTYGTYPGAFWELHQFSVDSEGNFYGADSFGGRTQKFRPHPGADKAHLTPTTH